MPPTYKNATEQQFQEWEALLEKGVPRFEASRLVGTTLRRLKNGDEVRFEQGVALAEERQAAAVEKLIVEQTERPEPSPQLIALRAKATHPDYADKSQVEITAKVEHEHRGEFTFGHIIAVAKQTGVLAQLGAGLENALPAAREIPAGSGGNPERAASDLPAAAE